MAVVIETTLGDITVDLYLEQRPVTCLNFLKLCKMKYYNFNLFHTIRSGFIAQTGDPSGEGSGGQSIFGVLEGNTKRFFSGEKMPKIRHTDTGLLSMVCTGDMMIGSQFFFTLGPDLDSLDGIHCVIGEVTEGHEVLRKLNDVICDETHRPYQDVRITHTVILEDPFNDPVGLRAPSRSPSPCAERLKGGRIAPDEELDETQGRSAAEVQELIEEKEAKARATILEIVGDLPDADIAPPENVLFVCKLNPVTSDEDLEIIFSRFGKIVSCEVIRDKKTGDSLQYAFIEFDDKKSCENAYFKMDNVLIDDRRIHVDFSQSVSKMKWLGKGRGVKYFNDIDSKDNEHDNHKSKYSKSLESDRNYKEHKNDGAHRSERERKHERDHRTNKGHRNDREKRNDREHRNDREQRHNREHRNDREHKNDREHRNKKEPRKDRDRHRNDNEYNLNGREIRNDKNNDIARDKDSKRYELNRSSHKNNAREQNYESQSSRKARERSSSESSLENHGDSQSKNSKKNINNPSRHHDTKYKEKGSADKNSNDEHGENHSYSKPKSNKSPVRKQIAHTDESSGMKKTDLLQKEDREYGRNKNSDEQIKHKTYKDNTRKRKHDNDDRRARKKKSDKSKEPRTPSPMTNTNEEQSDISKKHKEDKTGKKRHLKKKRKPSTSCSDTSESDSSDSSSSSTDTFSSDSDKKKRKVKRRKRCSTSSSSSSSSSSSTSSSSSDSSSASSSSDDSKKKTKPKKRNVVNSSKNKS